MGLYAALPLGDVLRQGAEMEDVQTVLIDLIREGRRLLSSVYQVKRPSVYVYIACMHYYSNFC